MTSRPRRPARQVRRARRLRALPAGAVRARAAGSAAPAAVALAAGDRAAAASAVLDLLDGAAVGSRGGQPRHEVELQAGYSLNGLGARVNASWKAATDVNGTLSSGDLHYSDQATIGVKLFADLTARPELISRFFWLRGSRISLDIDNVFDSRLEVRDALGNTPVGYQPDLLDPIGRTIKLSFRKLLF